MEKELFSNIKKLSKIAEPVVNINRLARIPECTRIKGDIVSEDDIRIDGNVEGKIRTQSRIVVGESASIKGSIYCNQMDFWGKIDGDIYVRDLLSLKGGSSVTGSIHVNKIQVEIGSQINGTIHMMTEDEYDALK